MSTLVLPFLTVSIVAGLTAAVIWLAVSRRGLMAELATGRRSFQACMDLAPFCAYIKDADGRYCYTNPAFIEIMRKGLPHVTSCLGRTDHDCFPAEHAQSYVHDDQRVLREGRPLAFDNSSVDASGTVHQWFSIKFPWIDVQGRDCIAGLSIDISEVQQAHASVRASEDRCALAVEAGRMGTLTLDLTTQMLDTSPLFAILHGRPATKTRLSLEESLAEVHPDDRQSILEAVQASLRNQAPSRIMYRVVRPDGGISWVELMGQVYTDEAGQPTIVRGVGFDVTDRQAAYEELTHRKAMLRRLIEVQENERQTLCHELHDGMIQYAIGAKMLLEAIVDAAESPVQAKRIGDVLGCLDRGIAEGRQVIRGVRSAVLDDLGLAAAIQDLVDQIALHGITVEATLDDDLDALPTDLQTTVYRIVQESLANVRKHAGTDRAAVMIRLLRGEVHARVSDDGVGFDVAEGRRRGFGLAGMTERVRLAGGTCSVESRPGTGTRVDARLPVTATGEEFASTAEVAPAYAAAPAVPPR